MAISFGLVEDKPKSLRTKRGRKSFFTPEGKVALAFLKMYTGLSAPKLMDALNGNIHYQIFCGIRISTEKQLMNYKLIDSILLEMSRMGLNLWFQKDDITFRYIYEIAEKMDWTVNIQFKMKEKKEY